ncbi:MAG: hypothetical protein ACD_62C00112G0004 [uncultured bacterium]|nr:MAG: hypothetical protein ACD_62C00112G0004 [uncultured bacterium]
MTGPYAKSGLVLISRMKKHPILAFVLLFVAIIAISVVVMGGLGMMLSSGYETPFIGDRVAVVEIKGPIFESIDVLKELKELQDDTQIKAVVLRLDSPGGGVAPSQEIFKQVLALKRDKKVVVSMASVAASGAYYIASAADKIIASPGTLTGSIGVIMESFGLQELIQKISIESRTIKSGAYKDVGNPFRELTPEDRAYLQKLSDDVYAQFVRDVAQARGIDPVKMPSIAEGRVYSGEQALALGLVDGLGNLYDAIDEANKLAGLPKDTKIRWPKEPSPFERVFKTNDAKTLKDVLLHQWDVMRLPLWLMDAKGMPVYQ